MRLTKILLITLLFSFTIVNAGGPIPKGCPLEGYEKNEYCPSYYTIGKVIKGISETSFTKKEMFRTDLYLEDSFEKYYILGNNYFYTENGLKNIKESFLVGEGWTNMGKINKGDVIIIDNFITGYEDKNEKNISIKTIEYLKNKIGFENDLSIIKSYGNYYKVSCKNDTILLSNEGKEYNLGYQHNEISDKKIGNKENIRQKLQNDIKTCENFNKMFNIKHNYKNNKNYNYKLNKYKGIIDKKYGKILSNITGKKLVKLLEKIQKLRQEKNNNKFISQDKKDNINILFDALIEVLKK